MLLPVLKWKDKLHTIFQPKIIIMKRNKSISIICLLLLLTFSLSVNAQYEWCWSIFGNSACGGYRNFAMTANMSAPGTFTGISPLNDGDIASGSPLPSAHTEYTKQLREPPLLVLN